MEGVMIYLSENLKKYRIMKKILLFCQQWHINGVGIMMRATLCFLYLKVGKVEKANRLASEIPHTRESREVIQPLIQQGLNNSQIDENIKNLLLGDGNGIW